MEINFWEEPDYQALYEISIAELGLSASAIVLLKEVGVTNVGDCIDYHINKHSVMINASRIPRSDGERSQRKTPRSWVLVIL